METQTNDLVIQMLIDIESMKYPNGKKETFMTAIDNSIKQNSTPCTLSVGILQFPEVLYTNRVDSKNLVHKMVLTLDEMMCSQPVDVMVKLWFNDTSYQHFLTMTLPYMQEHDSLLKTGISFPLDLRSESPGKDTAQFEGKIQCSLMFQPRTRTKSSSVETPEAIRMFQYDDSKGVVCYRANQKVYQELYRDVKSGKPQQTGHLDSIYRAISNKKHIADILSTHHGGSQYRILEERSELSLLQAIQEARTATMSRSQQVRMFARICLGVHELHSRKLVHGLLNPASIFFRDQNVSGASLYIGALHAVSDHPNKRNARDRCTENNLLAYRAPEQMIAGLPVSESADVWALGAIFCFILTGREIFVHSKDPTATHRAVDCRNEMEVHVPDSLPNDPDLVDLIANLLHIDATQRLSLNALRVLLFHRIQQDNKAENKQPAPSDADFEFGLELAGLEEKDLELRENQKMAFSSEEQLQSLGHEVGVPAAEIQQFAYRHINELAFGSWMKDLFRMCLERDHDGDWRIPYNDFLKQLTQIESIVSTSQKNAQFDMDLRRAVTPSCLTSDHANPNFNYVEWMGLLFRAIRVRLSTMVDQRVWQLLKDGVVRVHDKITFQKFANLMNLAPDLLIPFFPPGGLSMSIQQLLEHMSGIRLKKSKKTHFCVHVTVLPYTEIQSEPQEPIISSNLRVGTMNSLISEARKEAAVPNHKTNQGSMMRVGLIHGRNTSEQQQHQHQHQHTTNNLVQTQDLSSRLQANNNHHQTSQKHKPTYQHHNGLVNNQFRHASNFDSHYDDDDEEVGQDLLSRAQTTFSGMNMKESTQTKKTTGFLGQNSHSDQKTKSSQQHQQQFESLTGKSYAHSNAGGQSNPNPNSNSNYSPFSAQVGRF